MVTPSRLAARVAAKISAVEGRLCESTVHSRPTGAISAARTPRLRPRRGAVRRRDGGRPAPLMMLRYRPLAI